MDNLFQTAKSYFWNMVGENQIMAMATQAKDDVAVRTMSIVVLDDTMYCTSFEDSLKCAHIRQNNKMALCFDSVQMNGVAEIISDLDNEKMQSVLKKVEEYFPQRAKYSSQPGCVVIAFTPQKAKLFDASKNPPEGYSIDFVAQTAQQLVKK